VYCEGYRERYSISRSILRGIGEGEGWVEVIWVRRQKRRGRRIMRGIGVEVFVGIFGIFCGMFFVNLFWLKLWGWMLS